MAGGVAGAVDAKLIAFMRGRSLSWRGGENEGSTKCGGCGKRDNENVDAVCGVRESLERKLSVENSKAVGRGDWRGGLVFTIARWGGKGNTEPAATGGFGSLFRELKIRTFPVDVVVEMLEMLPPCVRGSAD